MVLFAIGHDRGMNCLEVNETSLLLGQHAWPPGRLAVGKTPHAIGWQFGRGLGLSRRPCADAARRPPDLSRTTSSGNEPLAVRREFQEIDGLLLSQGSHLSSRSQVP